MDVYYKSKRNIIKIYFIGNNMPKQKFNVKFINNRSILFNGEILKNNKTPGSRIIFKTKDYIIKMDNDDIYDSQCLLEYNNWKRIKRSGMAKYFVPILQKGKINKFNYTVQKRIPLQRGKRPTWARDFVRKIQKEYNFYDIYDNNANWTILDGQVLIFDYAL
jgi:hypothetical protein